VKPHSGWTDGLAAVTLTALNLWIGAMLFGLDYHQPLSSVEPVYMAIARWMTLHPDADWTPLWYLGVPIQNAYPPLLPSLVSWLGGMAAIEPAAAYHWLVGVAYAVGPAALYLLARTLGLPVFGAVAAAAGMTLVSPASLLLPSVWGDLGAAEGPRRLDALIRYGEGPHVLTLALWPLAVATLYKAVERRTPAWVGLAAVVSAATALTNWLGSVSLALAALSLLASLGWTWDRVRTALGTGLLAYALACPWLPLSTIQTIRTNAPRAGGDYPMGAVQALAWAVLLAGLLGAAWWWKRRSPAEPALRFAVVFSVLLGAPAAAMEFAGFHLMPQPLRFQLELEQGLWLLAGAGAAAAARRWERKAMIPAAVACVVLALVQAPRYRDYLSQQVEPVSKQSMLPYRVAQALSAFDPDARLYAAGSVEYWLNVFGDNPQVGGVFDQGVLWDFFQPYRFGLGGLEGDGERAARWLRALGAEAVFVSGADGDDPYRQYWRDPHKFDGVLEEIWREGDDALYAVPPHDGTLAYALAPGQAVERAPLNIEDQQAIAALDPAILEPARPLRSRWESPDHLVLEGHIQRADRILVQVAWHPGWFAYQDSLRAVVHRDALGMIVVEPAHDSQRLDLRYSGTTSFHLNNGESLLHHSTRVVAVVTWLAWLILARRRW